MLGTRSLRDRSASRDPEAGPATQAKQEGKEKMKDKAATGGWAEPSLTQKPSHRDHRGGSYYSVSDHMQPLGEAPNARVKARVKADGARKSILGKGAGGVGVDAQETPEGTPAPQTELQESPDMAHNPRIVVEDEDDGDYAPTGAAKKKKERAIRVRAGKRTSSAAADSTKTKAPSKAAAASKVVNRNSVYNAKKMKVVVEEAKGRAIAAGKPDLAEAVNEVYLNSLVDSNLTVLLEAILLQNATPEEREEFSTYVRAAKRKIRLAKEVKDGGRKAPSSANETPSLPHRSPSNFTSGQSQLTALPSTERPEPSKTPRLSLKTRLPSASTAADNHRSSLKNISSPLSPEKRDGSVDSDSSLTDMTSNPDDDGEGTAPVDSGNTTAVNSINGMQAKDHAAERGSLAAPRRNNLKRSSAEADLHDDQGERSGLSKKQKLPEAPTAMRNLKRSSAEAEVQDDEAERTLTTKKQKLSEGIKRDEDYPESNMRGSLNATPSRLRALRDRKTSTTNGTRATRSTRVLSPDPESPLSEPSPTASRQSTPHVPKKATNPTGQKAKTKQSPEKKHIAASSGLPGASGASKDSPVGDDDNEELSDNNDFCSACGGSGYLLCCDGCDRSFHFSCLDPPLSEDASELNEPWYCYICVAKRVVTNSPEKSRGGLFAPLLSTLKKRNPSNFALPQEIREYFEGVGIDKNGAFIEAHNHKAKTRPGYDEVPDFTKVKDNKGNTIHCYSCSKSSGGSRPIIQCDFCSEHWHLDCLDPPLANPPARNLEGKKLYDWMCPLHADHELRKVDTSLLNSRETRRKVHLRKPRNAKVAQTALGRGHRNNGIIEVVDDESDDSGSEFYDEDSQDEVSVARLPASGIKLDFIDKVKNNRYQLMRNAHIDRKAQLVREVQRAAKAPKPLQQANFSRRSFVEKQTALNLAQFANAHEDLNLTSDKVENLVATLIAEAPSHVVGEIMAAEEKAHAKAAAALIPPSPPASEQMNHLSADQRKELEMLQELIRRRLENGKS